MREQDMRARIERFIQSRLRSMLMPATLGLGMALAGCEGDGLSADDGGDPMAMKDAGDQKDAGTATKYLAPVPDAGPDLAALQPDYMAPNPRPDAGPVVRYMAQIPDADPGPVVALYIAQMP